MMAKMTAKYSGAVRIAHRQGISTEGNQEDLYQRLQKSGFFWNSQEKSWEEHDIEDANEPTALIMVRVWSDLEIVEDVAGDLIRSTKKQWQLIDQSTPYPCRPPKQREGRVYLKFLPRRQ